MELRTALQRVLAHKRLKERLTKKKYPTMEGIFLSNLQLKTLGENLMSMADGPDGLCFMIGIDKINDREIKTVEVLPYSKTDDPSKNKKIFNNGVFNLNAGGINEDTLWDLIFYTNGHRKQWKENLVAPFTDDELITNPNQRTPPPFS